MTAAIHGFLRQHWVALIALSVALCGSAYAADLIGPKEIARNAVRSKHVKDDSLTGVDIDESGLGAVPKAVEATSAQTAGTATLATSAGAADTAASAATSAQAANADKLDNLDSVEFVRGGGRIASATKVVANGAEGDVLSVPGLGGFAFECDTSASHQNTLQFNNTSGIDLSYDWDLLAQNLAPSTSTLVSDSIVQTGAAPNNAQIAIDNDIFNGGYQAILMLAPSSSGSRVATARIDGFMGPGSECQIRIQVATQGF